MTEAAETRQFEIVLPGAPQLDPVRVVGLVADVPARVAVYVGLRGLSSRPDCYAVDVPDVVKYADAGRQAGFAVYVAANAELDDDGLRRLDCMIPVLSEAQVAGVIVSDLAAIRRLGAGPLPVHVSSIFPTYNSATVRALVDMGVTRIVLPTNVTWDAIEELAACRGGCEIELIVAGGVCFNDCARCGLPHESVDGRFVVACREAAAHVAGGPRERAVWLLHADPARIVERALSARVTALKVEGRSETWEVVSARVAGLCAALGARRPGEGDPDAGAGVYEL